MAHNLARALIAVIALMAAIVFFLCAMVSAYGYDPSVNLTVLLFVGLGCAAGAIFYLAVEDRL